MTEPIFLSKLIAPTPTTYYLRRAGLMKKLAAWQSVKCSLLVSSAGYGKTSFISQFIEDHKITCAWYQITEEDDALFPFLRHVIASIQQKVPTFGQTMVGWDAQVRFHNSEELLQLSKQFVNELHYISHPLTLVLDDYHHVSHVFAINFVMTQILTFLPAHLHIIVASRKLPEWHNLHQLRMKNQLMECTEADFLFSEEDIQFLFADFFERTLTAVECRLIMQMTEGWAMGILLLAYQAKYNRAPIEQIAKGSLQSFFSYLSEEIFDKLAPHTQQHLLALSIHQVIDISVLHHLYEEPWVTEVVRSLQQIAFVHVLVPGQKYRFHALFQQFLQQRLQQKPHLFEAYHTEAAAYYAQKGVGTLAIAHAANLEKQQLFITLLRQLAPQLIEDGQYDYLLERLRVVPNKHYELTYYEAESQRYRAQYDKAKQAYQICFQQASDASDTLWMMRAQFGLANIYLDTLQPVFAKRYLEATITLLHDVDVTESERQKINSYYTENLINLGRAGEAQRWSKQHHVQVALNNIDVRMLLRQGKLQEAKELLQTRMTEPFQWDEAHRMTDLLLVLVHLFMGEHEEAYVLSIENETAIFEDMPFTKAVTKLRKGLALLQLQRDATFAKTCFDETLMLMDRIHVKRVKAECYMGLTLYAIDAEEATAYAELGLHETQKVQDDWMSALLLIALTKSLAEAGQAEEAIERALQAQHYFQQSEDLYGQMIASFWLAYCYRTEDITKGRPYYETFMTICTAQYPFFITKETLFGPTTLLTFCQLSEQFNTAKATAHVVKAPQHTLQLTLFGPSMIRRDGQIITDKDWKRMKAKELFLYLYRHRNQFVSRAQLCEAIWAHDDEAMSRDFKVVYNALLKILEPTRQAREESHFIERHQQIYKLQAQWIEADIVYFERYMARGLTEKQPQLANEWLLLAMSYVNGSFCEEFEKEWVSEVREQVNAQVVLTAERLAQNFVRMKNFHAVLEWAAYVLTIDEGYEEAYRLIMLAHYYLGNRRDALKTYEQCQMILREWYGLAPMEATEQLYDLVLQM